MRTSSAYPRHAESAVNASLALGFDEENVALIVLRFLEDFHFLQDHLTEQAKTSKNRRHNTRRTRIETKMPNGSKQSKADTTAKRIKSKANQAKASRPDLTQPMPIAQVLSDTYYHPPYSSMKYAAFDRFTVTKKKQRPKLP